MSSYENYSIYVCTKAKIPKSLRIKLAYPKSVDKLVHKMKHNKQIERVYNFVLVYERKLQKDHRAICLENGTCALILTYIRFQVYSEEVHINYKNHKIEKCS